MFDFLFKKLLFFHNTVKPVEAVDSHSTVNTPQCNENNHICTWSSLQQNFKPNGIKTLDVTLL